MLTILLLLGYQYLLSPLQQDPYCQPIQTNYVNVSIDQCIDGSELIDATVQYNTSNVSCYEIVNGKKRTITVEYFGDGMVVNCCLDSSWSEAGISWDNNSAVFRR